ncbi:MAG: calcium/sodium antiporter [Clostridia bacterium]|nr:calcium/sodium antiporter [Clostridia bacterium]
MDMFIAIVLLVIGFVCLVKGADWFVDGAAGIAEKLRVPTLIIGLTIVAFGTSAPELATSIISAVDGDASLAVGNILGSNITNILLILGVAAIICPLLVQKDTLRMDFPVLLGASVLFLAFGLDGEIARWEGLVLFAISMVYTVVLIWVALRARKKETIPDLETHALEDPAPETAAKGFKGWYERMKTRAWFLSVLTLVGLGIVVLGAQLAVEGATTIAVEIGLSQRIIGLTVVAIGTSLPELVTAVVAASKGETDIAVGDIVGSCIFNILRTIGITSMILPLDFESAFRIDGIIAIATAALLAVLAYLPGHKIKRWGGIVMLVGFASYYVYLFAL